MNKAQELSKGKYLSYLLRHGLEKSGLNYTSQGYVSVAELLSHLKWSSAQLNQIVENNNKRRYEFSPDKSQIRACQGHSVAVNLELEKKEPPPILYHGTTRENLPSILATGLQKRSRHAVHLSADKNTAFKVGARHSSEVVLLSIKAQEIFKEKGFVFEVSSNGVWLIEEVEPRFIFIE